MYVATIDSVIIYAVKGQQRTLVFLSSDVVRAIPILSALVIRLPFLSPESGCGGPARIVSNAVLPT